MMTKDQARRSFQRLTSPLRTRYDHNDDWAEATITATNRDGTFDLEVENVGIVENVSKVRRTKKEFVATFTQ